VSARAELIDDRGAAARSDDFFRSAHFYAAQGVTHTLRVIAQRHEANMPLRVREIPGSEHRDAISPYGYSGGVVSGDGPRPGSTEVDWSGFGLVSIFVRDRIGGVPCFADATMRATVLTHDPARPREIRRRLAEQIRSNERRGWEVSAVGGPEASDPDVDFFAAAYQQTMVRAHAAPGYFIERGYVRAILGYERSWLLIARGAGGEPGAGAIAALSDGLLHYYLGATADAALGESPFKNVVGAMLDLADELRRPRGTR
jgi:hypothetical protein